MRILFIFLSLIALSSVQAQDSCFEEINLYDAPTWECEYFPKNIERDDLITFITNGLLKGMRNTDDLYIINNSQNNSVYIQTTNKKFKDFIEERLPRWDNTDKIITTLTPLKIKIDYYVLEENETTGFKAGISQVQKSINQELNGDEGDESEVGKLTKKAIGLLIAGGTSGLTAAISSGLDNFSIYLGNKRQKSLMRHHKTYEFENSDRDYFELSEIAQMDITSPNNTISPQIIDVGIRVSGRMQLNGGKESKLLYVPFISFDWTRVEDLENRILPKFRYERSDSNWVLGVPKLIATAEVNQHSDSRSSDLLSFEKGKEYVRKKLAIVVTVTRADNLNSDPLIGNTLVQTKKMTQEDLLYLSKKEVDCKQIQDSIELKVVRDHFGKADLKMKLHPALLTAENYNMETEIEVIKKGDRKGRDTKHIILKDIAYYPQTIYSVIPEKEGTDYIELTMKFSMGEKRDQCKFKSKATYNLENGVFRLQ